MNMTVNLTDTSLTTRLADPVFREYINKACEVVQRSGKWEEMFCLHKLVK